MALVIIKNDSTGHLGTIDRERLLALDEDGKAAAIANPGPPNFYDYPGKHAGFTAAFESFCEATLPCPGQERFLGPDGSPEPSAELVMSARLPSAEQLEAVHSREHLEMLDRNSRLASTQTIPLVFEDNSEAHISPGTARAARTAVGAALDAVDVVLQDASKTAIANVWPPGHHAESSRHGGRDIAHGFCYLSTAAIAALYARDHALRVDPSRPNRVLVIDIDNHEGDGTRTALANEPDIMVMDAVQRSPHWDGRYVDGYVDSATGKRTCQASEFPAYHDDPDAQVTACEHVYAPNIMVLEFWKPESPPSATFESLHTGVHAAATPEEILERFISEGCPAAERFNPDIVIWSLGIDSAQNDPLGGMGHIPGSFYTMIRGLRLTLPNSRHVGITEGGYLEKNWELCLPPIAAAFHGRPDELKNHSRLFARFAGAFASPRLREALLSGDLGPVTEVLRACRLSGDVRLSSAEFRSIATLLARTTNRDTISAFAEECRCSGAAARMSGVHPVAEQFVNLERAATVRIAKRT
jgi:acetoin utilization deacetylase AcuC-like enzyme